jgi:hypothetical protein
VGLWIQLVRGENNVGSDVIGGWGLQIIGPEACLFRDFREDNGTKLFGIVEGEGEVRPTVSLHDFVGARRPLMTPSDLFQRGKNAAGLGGWPRVSRGDVERCMH